MASRLSLTTRGAFAIGIAPSSAIAGFVLGAEELVLLSVALFALLACGFIQCTARARAATDPGGVSPSIYPSAKLKRASPCQ